MSNSAALPSVTLVKIDKEEFRLYAKWSAKNYADNLVSSGTEKCRLKALIDAKKEYKDVFPDGSDTKDNYLYIVTNEKNEKIGVIGYQKSPFEDNAAFIIENVIKEEYRGKGYGKSALVKLQEDAREKGFPKIVLNAFKHSPISFGMYQRNGFKIIEDYDGSVIMEKYL